VIPVEYAWGLICALKLLTAALGAYALARQLRLRRGGALVAGLVFMLCAPNVVWLQWPHGTVFTLLPWLLLAVDRLYRRPSARGVAVLGAAVGLLVLAGHPESAFLASSAAGVYLIALALADRRARALPGHLGRFLAGHALGAGIGAVAAVPFLQAYADSITREAHGVLAKGHLPLESAVVFLLPNLYGSGRPDYFGPPFGYLTVAAYFGVVALLLAVVALVRRRPTPAGWALGAMAAVSAMVVFGIPPVRWVIENVPPFESGNNHRVFFVIALAAAIGAGAGYDSLARRALPLRHAAALCGGLLALTGALLGALSLAGELPAPRDVEEKAVLLFALAFGVGAALLALLGRVGPRAGMALALVAVLVDLAYLQNHNAILPRDEAYPPKPAALAALEREPEPFRVTGVRSSVQQPLVMPPNTAALYGLEDVQGYDYPQPRRFADFSWYVLRFRGITRELNFLTPRLPSGPRLAGLRMFNTRYYVAPPGTPAPTPAFEPFYKGADATVFRDREALPRAFVVGRTRELAEDRSLIPLITGALDPRREALVPPGASAPPDAAKEFREARTEILAPDRVRVHLPAGGGGWLVLANSYSAQWRAEVDGRDEEIRPTNHTQMGLPVAAGARTVEFRLDRSGFWAGVAISLASLALTALLALRPRRRPA